MKHFKTEIDIAASADMVWRVLADLDSWQEWNTFMPKAQGELVQGGSIEIYFVPPGGKGVEMKTTLLTVDPNHELRWAGVFLHKILFTGKHYFIIEPRDEGGVTFVHGEYFSGILIPFMGGLLKKVFQGYGEMNQALKSRVEATL